MYAFPRLPEHARLRKLSDFGLAYITGETGTTVALAAAPLAGPMLVFKNGALLDQRAAVPDYSVDGKTITFASALIASDAVQVLHWYRDGE